MINARLSFAHRKVPPRRTDPTPEPFRASVWRRHDGANDCCARSTRPIAAMQSNALIRHF
ncbi:hypothetical protein BSIN_1818 [Burkholderia singularis]|uniref:Uncharacterized protein n=1 Tax=Burkholderia singularis TaxID=1503053 RepID=A0A238GZX8_9BURK|nr:hypothetical protein BSIN_1818 [Burkholderia singularis]